MLLLCSCDATNARFVTDFSSSLISTNLLFNLTNFSTQNFTIAVLLSLHKKKSITQVLTIKANSIKGHKIHQSRLIYFHLPRLSPTYCINWRSFSRGSFKVNKKTNFTFSGWDQFSFIISLCVLACNLIKIISWHRFSLVFQFCSRFRTRKFFITHSADADDDTANKRKKSLNHMRIVFSSFVARRISHSTISYHFTVTFFNNFSRSPRRKIEDEKKR